VLRVATDVNQMLAKANIFSVPNPMNDLLKSMGVVRGNADPLSATIAKGGAASVPNPMNDLLKSMGAVRADRNLLSETLAKVGAVSVPLRMNDLLKSMGGIQAGTDQLSATLTKVGAGSVPMNDLLKSMGGIQAGTDQLSATLTKVGAVSVPMSDLLKSMGAMGVGAYANSAARAIESAALVTSALPSRKWLEAAQSAGRGVAVPHLEDLAKRIAVGATSLAVLHPESTVVRRSTQSSLRAWESQVDRTAFQPSPQDLQTLTLEGAATLSVVDTAVAMTSDSELSSDEPDGDIVDRSRFRSFLAELGPGVVGKWEGALERIQHPGPDAASQAAHSLVELVDWSLRKKAPDTVVLAWHKAQARPISELANGRPTRDLRLRYLLRNRTAEAEGAEVHIRSLVAFVRILQRNKHAENASDLLAIRRLVPGIESMLFFVLGYE
jgi:hypothetical protein